MRPRRSGLRRTNAALARRAAAGAGSVSVHEWSPCSSGPVLAPSVGCCRRPAPGGAQEAPPCSAWRSSACSRRPVPWPLPVARSSPSARCRVSVPPRSSRPPWQCSPSSMWGRAAPPAGAGPAPADSCRAAKVRA